MLLPANCSVLEYNGWIILLSIRGVGDLFEQLTIDKGLFEIGLYPNGYIPLLFEVNDFLQTL